MYERLRDYILEKIHHRLQISDAEFEILKEGFRIRRLRKKQYLLQPGEVARHHAFVCKGCLRVFRVDEKGQEHIIQFAIENWWASDRESLISGQPSKYYIEALEDSELLLAHEEDMAGLQEKVPALKAMVQHIQQNNVIATQNRIHAAISYGAEQKYLEFIKAYPAIFQRVPQQMIASYLGITRETLSRIRRQVK